VELPFNKRGEPVYQAVIPFQLDRALDLSSGSYSSVVSGFVPAQSLEKMLLAQIYLTPLLKPLYKSVR
jgi:hypothetical protein